MIIFNYALIFFWKYLFLQLYTWMSLAYEPTWVLQKTLRGGITGENTNESLLNQKLVNVSCYDFI